MHGSGWESIVEYMYKIIIDEREMTMYKLLYFHPWIWTGNDYLQMQSVPSLSIVSSTT